LDTSHARGELGEFGEFRPAAHESHEQLPSPVMTTEPLGGAARLSAALHPPTDPVMAPCVEGQPKVWKRVHRVDRSNQPHGHVVRFTTAALETLVP
jgi:hypothetical protein